MHELSIAEEMVEILVEHLTDYPGSSVESVVVAVGDYSGVNPDSLRFVFPFAAEGTPVEGSDLKINTIRVSVKCLDCGERTDDISTPLCSKCGSRNLEFASGRELEILSFDISTGAK